MATNTNADKKFYVCTTPQPNDLTLEQFEALDYVRVAKVGRIGEMGTTVNIVSYSTLDNAVQEKGKGVANAGDPEVEVARVYNDPGQIALRAMAKTNQNYAFKTVSADAPTESHTDTTIYSRGLVVGPRRPNGQREDFELEIYTLGLNQLEVVADPELISS